MYLVITFARALAFAPYQVHMFLRSVLDHETAHMVSDVFDLLYFAALLFALVFLVRHIRRQPRRRLLKEAAVVAAVIGLMYAWSAIPRPYNQRPNSFDGDSATLERTQVVATLAEPVQPHKNVVWCASFQAAWKKLQNDLAKEPVKLAGGAAACALLNASPMPEVPDGELYTAVGWANKGILDEIRREKLKRFPGTAEPNFPGIVPDSFVAYSYLQSACKFRLPYFDSEQAFEFTDSQGKKSQIRTFGIREKDDYAYDRLRRQLGILYRKGDVPLEEFAVDLCKDSEPTQVVFAWVPLAGTLQETVTSLEQKIAAYKPEYEHQGEMGPNDVLLVPDIAYRLVHQFSDLAGKTFENAALAGQRADVMQQEIQFRLDKSGADLSSESKMYMAPIPAHFVANGPFLIYLKQRGAASPYFVMWVDNDELLTKWN